MVVTERGGGAACTGLLYYNNTKEQMFRRNFEVSASVFSSDGEFSSSVGRSYGKVVSGRSSDGISVGGIYSDVSDKDSSGNVIVYVGPLTMGTNALEAAAARSSDLRHFLWPWNIYVR